MCGRYSILRSRREHEQFFKAIAQEGFSLMERYNAAPRQFLPVVVDGKGNRKRIPMQWGYIPTSIKDTAHETRINTRTETLKLNPAYLDLLHHNRCIIPASGFYEWDKSQKVRTPYYFYSKQADFLSFAGIWQSRSLPDGRKFKAFTIITTEADPEISRIHNRMPLILSHEEVDVWLDPATAETALHDLMQQTPLPLQYYPVSTAVNNPKNDSPYCIVEEQPKQPCLL